MNIVQQNNIFRLAAIIYGQSLNVVSIKNTYKTVIDDALFRCSTATISLTNLIVFINKEYGLLFSEKEIIEIIKDGRNASSNYSTYNEQGELIISLTPEYKNKLSLISSQKNLINYIDEYLVIYEHKDEKYKELILHFLYEMFTNNLEGYKLILLEKFENVAANISYTDEDKVIINDFLNWPDDDKNKAIYDLASYALEYCMMTNKKNTSVNVQSLKNKLFYIDTNIIYRAIGLNGENLKIRANLFLSKFKDVGEKLVISQSTYLEFVDTIDYYITKIDKAQRPRVQSKVLSDFISEETILLYYQKWCINRYNRDPQYFRDWVMSEFSNLCTKYDIVHEVNYPFDIDKCKDLIIEYSSGIYKYGDDKPHTSAEFDAENVLWVEEKRKGSGDDIYQAKAFFLSSDNSLRKWDYQRNTHRVPIVMSPSQWLSIILQYVERTSDDYKSFVSFLTLTIHPNSWPVDKLSLIISGISEVTSDIENQKFLVQHFIERNTFESVEKKTDEELEKYATSFAKSEMDKRIDELEKNHLKTAKSLLDTKQSLDEAFRQIEEQKQTKQRVIHERDEAIKKSKKTEEEIVKLKNEIKRQKLIKWKAAKIIIWGFVILFSILICLLIYFWNDFNWNFMSKFVSFLDTKKDSVAGQIGNKIITLPVLTIIYGCYMIRDAISIKEYDNTKCHLFWKSDFVK